MHFYLINILIVLLTGVMSSCSDFGQSLHDIKQTQQGQRNNSQSLQTIHVPIQSAQKAWHTVDETPFSVSYTPTNQNSYNWHESIQLNFLPYQKRLGINARKYTELEADDAKKNCKHIVYKIYKQTSRWLIYALNAYGCPDGHNHLQIGKAFNGIDGVYRVRYTAYEGEVTKQDLAIGAHVISDSSLQNN